MTRFLLKTIPVVFLLLMLQAGSVHAQVTEYTDEAAYLADLAASPCGVVSEGFEDNAVWGVTRFPNTATAVTSNGTVWTSNFPDNDIQTSSGAAYSGDYGVYSSPHGDPNRDKNPTRCDVTPPPDDCLMHDGFIGTRDTGAGAFCGVGGWFMGTSGGKIVIILDGDDVNPYGFGNPLDAYHQFFGVIDAGGFTTFEVREIEGKTGDEKLVFADDFTFGTTGGGAVCGNGVIEAGEDCDDGNTQSGDCCSATCRFEPDGSSCSDGVFCNGDETCDGAGDCVRGPPVDCSDGVGCTDDVCDETTASCVNTANDANCPDDGLFCNGTEFCDEAAGCASTGDPCPTGRVCMEATDTCEASASCGNGKIEAGEACDDGNTQSGDCCSADCQYEPAGSPCADSQFCNGEETCDGAGACLPGTPVDCDDGVDCTVDACDEVNDACVNTANDANCPDDGLFCTGQEICDADLDCISTGDPCASGETCNDDMDICESPPSQLVDLDIKRFWIVKRTRLDRKKPIAVKLMVKNNGTVDEPRTATVTGEQNNVTVYFETLEVSDPVGKGYSRFVFPPFRPDAAGCIVWTAHIDDDDPDDDTAVTRTTVIKPHRR